VVVVCGGKPEVLVVGGGLVGGGGILVLGASVVVECGDGVESVVVVTGMAETMVVVSKAKYTRSLREKIFVDGDAIVVMR